MIVAATLYLPVRHIGHKYVVTGLHMRDINVAVTTSTSSCVMCGVSYVQWRIMAFIWCPPYLWCDVTRADTCVCDYVYIVACRVRCVSDLMSFDWCAAHVWGDATHSYMCGCEYGVATISRLLKIIGLFCKRAL